MQQVIRRRNAAAQSLELQGSGWRGGSRTFQKVRDDRMHVIENLDAGLVQPYLSTSLPVFQITDADWPRTGPGILMTVTV